MYKHSNFSTYYLLHVIIFTKLFIDEQSFFIVIII